PTKPQVQVERPQAKPRTNDLEVRRAAAILAQRGRLQWSQNRPEVHRTKIAKWVQNPSKSGSRTHPKSHAGGHIQLPQLHRDAAFPAAVVLAPAAPRRRLDQPIANQGAVNGRAGHLAKPAAVHLEHQPPRPPLGVAAPKLADRFLNLGGNPPRMVMDLVAA